MHNKLFTYQIYILLGIFSTLFLCPYIISLLKRFKARQTLRKEGPSEHKIKEGTPTMGGIAILLVLLGDGFSDLFGEFFAHEVTDIATNSRAKKVL